MPGGLRGEKRPAEVVGNAVLVMRLQAIAIERDTEAAARRCLHLGGEARRDIHAIARQAMHIIIRLLTPGQYMNPPPLPRSIVRELQKRFTLEHVEKARNEIVKLATTCVDTKIRLECARYITETVKADDKDYFAGEAAALVQLATMPKSEQPRAALQLFANQQCSRSDLDTISKLLAADQSEVIEMLRAQNTRLEKGLVERRSNGTIESYEVAQEGIQ